MTRRRTLSLGLAAALTVGIAVGGVQLTRAAGGGTATAVVPVEPYRILDTRNGIGAPAAPVAGGSTIDVQVAGVGPVPTDAVGVVLNLTGTRTTEPTYVTAWPTGTAMPTASALNLTPGIDAPNNVTALLGDGGKISLYNFTGTTDLIADVAAYLTPTASDGGGTGPTGPAGPQGPAGPTAGTFANNLRTWAPGSGDAVVADVQDAGQGGTMAVTFPARIVINAMVSVAAVGGTSGGFGTLSCGAEIWTVGVGTRAAAGPRVRVIVFPDPNETDSDVVPINASVDRPAGSYGVWVVCTLVASMNGVRPSVEQASLTAIAVAR